MTCTLLIVALVFGLADVARSLSSCTINDTGREGVCTPFADCRTASEGIPPQKCDDDLVCCTEEADSLQPGSGSNPWSSLKLRRSSRQLSNSWVFGSPQPGSNSMPWSSRQPGSGSMPWGNSQPGGGMPWGNPQPGGPMPWGNSQPGGSMSWGSRQPGSGSMPWGSPQPGAGSMSWGSRQPGGGSMQWGNSQPGGSMPWGNRQPGGGSMPWGSPQPASISQSGNGIQAGISSMPWGSSQPQAPHHKPCTVKKTGRPGECLRINKCSVVLDAAHMEGILPQICGFEGTVSIVCCPRATDEGSGCTMMDTGRTGKCRPLANCQSAEDNNRRGILPQKCANELVCCVENAVTESGSDQSESSCPPLSKEVVTQELSGSKAADYCVKLAEKIFPCQNTSFGLERGDLCPLIPDPNAEFTRFPLKTTSEIPHCGVTGTGEIGSISWWGATTLLSERWLVSSASSIGSWKVDFVGLGGIYKPFYTPDDIYHVMRVVFHPEFNPTYSKTYYDLALVEIDGQVKFTSRILPVCLHTGSPLPDSGLIFTGWDYITLTEIKKSMKEIPLSECSTLFSMDGNHPDGVKQDLQICGRPLNIAGSYEDTAFGSAFYLYNGPRVACTNLLIGLSSAHHNQSDTTIYTRISGYLPWIESVLWP